MASCNYDETPLIEKYGYNGKILKIMVIFTEVFKNNENNNIEKNKNKTGLTNYAFA